MEVIDQHHALAALSTSRCPLCESLCGQQILSCHIEENKNIAMPVTEPGASNSIARRYIDRDILTAEWRLLGCYAVWLL
jgi:hypothetical protein